MARLEEESGRVRREGGREGGGEIFQDDKSDRAHLTFLLSSLPPSLPPALLLPLTVFPKSYLSSQHRRDPFLPPSLVLLL
jgi:hypothetical protein